MGKSGACRDATDPGQARKKGQHLLPQFSAKIQTEELRKKIVRFLSSKIA